MLLIHFDYSLHWFYEISEAYRGTAFLLMISFIVNTCLLTIGISLIGHTLRNVVTSQKNVCGKLASVWNEKVRAEAKSEQIRPVARYLVESNEYWESIKINLTMFCKKFIDQCTYDRWQQM